MIADFIKFCDGWDSTKKTFFFWKAEEFYLLLLLFFFWGGRGRGVWRRFRKIKKLFLWKWPFYMMKIIWIWLKVMVWCLCFVEIAFADYDSMVLWLYAGTVCQGINDGCSTCFSLYWWWHKFLPTSHELTFWLYAAFSLLFNIHYWNLSFFQMNW